jgi:hypothetical protein
MKLPKAAVGAGVTNGSALGIPAAVVILVILLGAIIYLRQAKYIRRPTAYTLSAALVLALAVLCLWIYSNPM